MLKIMEFLGLGEIFRYAQRAKFCVLLSKMLRYMHFLKMVLLGGELNDQ